MSDQNHFVRLTNGSNEKPTIYIGLPLAVAQEIFGADVANAHKHAHRASFFAKVQLVGSTIILTRAKSLSEDAGNGFAEKRAAIVEAYLTRDGAAPGTSFMCLRLREGLIDRLIIEGHCGREPDPKKHGAFRTKRNKTVAVNGRNEFNHPCHLHAGQVDFSLPSNWVEPRQEAARPSFQPELSLLPTAREEALSAAVADVVAAPEPCNTPSVEQVERALGQYTVNVPKDLIEKMVLGAIAAGRSVIIDKSTGWVEII